VESVLSRRERDELTQALRQWAESAPPGPALAMLDTDWMTPPEIAIHVAEGTDEGEAILEILEHSVRRDGLDSVVSRLLRPTSR
jgi:hypothetical protein